jgi:transcriptional regulator with XRE-family HTH domain
MNNEPKEDQDRIELGKRLHDARESAGLSQGQIAGLMGLHRPTISEIEAGRRKTSVEELKKFAEYYGVSHSWLLGETTMSLESSLAFREMEKLKGEDLDTLIGLLTMLKKSKEKQ